MKNIVILLCLTGCGSVKEGPPGPAGENGATGAMGVAGATGVRGATGPTGDAAITTLIQASLFCAGQLATTGIYFTYSAVVFKSSDVFASGSIRGSQAEISNTKFFEKDQVGAVTATVQMEYDLQGSVNAGYWTISVNRATAVTTIVSHDIDDMTTYTMTPDKCVVNTY